MDLDKVPFDVQADGRFEHANSGSQPNKLLGGPHRIQITLAIDSAERPTVTLMLTAVAG